MKDTLRPGLTHQFKFKIPPTKTVPHLYPESEMFQEMPQVLATGFMVGLMEWACIDALRPHLDWPREQSLGTLVNFSHLAATPPGFTITVDVRLDKVEGRKLTFSLSAHDGMDKIAEGTHERFVIDATRFNARIEEKVARARQSQVSRPC
ncbi:MAG: thioesterase [Betaproteobacteria bacterium RIFCSPLOWO2_12_FULL_62_13]|nr:MAG: thioesterase [Betaproteobacteria bacterium RIFCSPLOWO2_12_FULL_62_13]